MSNINQLVEENIKKVALEFVKDRIHYLGGALAGVGIVHALGKGDIHDGGLQAGSALGALSVGAGKASYHIYNKYKGKK